MKTSLKTFPVIADNTAVQLFMFKRRAVKWTRDFESELRELFENEETIAETNQDLYYLDKICWIKRMILGEEE